MNKERILIVEDEVIVGMDIQEMLIESGYDVPLVVDSGEEAIQKAGELQPDLVLMDIIIKGSIDGITAAEEIRKRYGIPVIFTTAYGDDKTVNKAKITEPLGYLLKPIDSKDLKIAIEVALYKSLMEVRLKESKAWFETTLKSIADGVIAINKAGLITFMNDAAENITGWSADEAIGKDLIEVFNIIGSDNSYNLEKHDSENLVDSNIIANHIILNCRTKERTVVETSDSAIINDKGEIFGVVLVFRKLIEDMKSAFGKTSSVKVLNS
ncbi:MAG: response regulator [Ignavibacteria bacterium]